jgi:hypothetical protein
MNIGALAWTPSRRSWMTWPISWMNSSTTKPTANLQPQMSEYAAMLTSIDPDVVRILSLGRASSATLPNFRARAPATNSGPSSRRRVEGGGPAGPRAGAGGGGAPGAGGATTPAGVALIAPGGSHPGGRVGRCSDSMPPVSQRD